MKPYKHVSIVTVDIDRRFFTPHGLHMNNLGKEKISAIVKNVFQKQKVKISLSWKNGCDISAKNVSDNQAEINTSVQVNSKTTLVDIEVPIITPSPDEGPRISKRKKKPPTTMSEDFPW